MCDTTLEFLHRIADEHFEANEFEWEGKCHDCGEKTIINVKLLKDGFEISGGALYHIPEIEEKSLYLRCVKCMEGEKLLRGYQPNEVYSRVVGYLRPVSNYNLSKQQEFKDRKLFDRSLDESI